MNDLRKLALIIEYLKDLLRPQQRKPSERNKASDTVLAVALENAQKGHRGAVGVNLYFVGRIRKGVWPESEEEVSKLLAACGRILKDKEDALDVSAPVPQWLEDSYGRRLKFKNVSTGRDTSTPADKLGELADILSGGWRFFYLSPIDRSRQPDTQIRSTIAIFQHASSDDRSIGLTLISGNGVWRGEGFLNQHHIYLRVSDADRNETAFFVTNRPYRPDLKIVGVGAALERAKEQERKIAISSVAAVVCFGQKVKDEEDVDAATSTTIMASHRGHNLSPADVEHVQTSLCKTYTLEEFSTKFAALNSYINRVKINERQGLFDGAWIYLSYF